MSEVISSIDGEVPVRTTYNLWTQFEGIPRFREGIEAVHQLGDGRLFWRAQTVGKEETWTARITARSPASGLA
jgi:uncharacterized membrane protein